MLEKITLGAVPVLMALVSAGFLACIGLAIIGYGPLANVH
jgi:hypothetical protein